MSTASKKATKRIFLVNRDFQLRYMRSSVLVGIVSTALTSLLILYPLYEFKIIRIAQFLPTPVMVAMVLAALANVLFVAYMTIFFTHRVAGPMFALVRQMRIVEEGSLNAILHTRDSDEMKYVTRNFNAMVDALRHQTEADIAKLDRVVEELEDLARKGQSPASIDDARGLLQSFKQRMERKIV